MKAIIMAGGEGSRLRPLTCDCPKPMLRLMGRPMMEYAVELLHRTGIDEIGATLGYLPDQIQDYFGDSLRWYTEKTPLGTAGSVGQARDFLDERFIVLSGDGITDFDLSAAILFHEEKQAMATLILHRCNRPQEYGMVVCDSDGRIRAFHEKPGRCDVYSDRINTGIYILEPEILDRIPENCPYDFGHDLFPALVAEGMPVYGCTMEGYWCDVGDISAYLQVHFDAMDGKIQLDFSRSARQNAILEPGCKLEPPYFIADGARIWAGARIGPYAVIGEGSVVHPGAGIKHSVVFSHAQVDSGAQLRGCAVCSGARIGVGAHLFEESAVGSRSIVGAHALLSPGVKLWPEKQLAEGLRPDANIVWGSRREQRFLSGALQLETPAQATRAAAAIAAEMQPRELLIGRSGSTVACAMWHAVCSGAMAQGIQVMDAGICSLPQLRHAQMRLHAGASLLVQADRLIPLNQLGAYLHEKQQRAILKLCERQDFPGPFTGLTRPMQSAGRTDIAYIAEAASCFTADPLLAPSVALCSADHHLLSLAEGAFSRAGLKTRSEWNAEQFCPEENEIGVFLPGDGEEAIFSDAKGRLDDTQSQLARAWLMLEEGAGRLVLPLNATRAIETIARDRGACAVYPSGERAAWMNAVAAAEPRQFLLHCDGIRFALAFLSRLVEKGVSLDGWRMQLPPVFRSARMLRMPENESGRVLHALAESCPEAQMGGGLRLPRSDGWAWFSPDEPGMLEIIAEAGDMETARGMCDFFEGELKRLMAEQD